MNRLLPWLLCAACATHGPSTRDEDREGGYLFKELPVTGTARVEEAGEQELRGRVQHDRHTTEVLGEIEYAPVDGLQLDLELPYLFHHGAGAADDGVPFVEFGLRGELLTQPRELALTLAGKVTAPVDETQTGYEVQALAARRVGEFELHGAVGIAWDAHATEYPWSAAVATAAPWPDWFATVEAFGAGSDAAVAPGLVLALSHHLEAAIAVPMRLSGEAEPIGVAIGFLIEW